VTERTVGVVGAGGAGLVAAQALMAVGIEPVVYEAREGLGGNWRYDPDPGRSSCYASLVTNTSRWQTTLRSYRLPRFGRPHLRHDEMLAYLERFAEHFGIDGHILFNTEVGEAVSSDTGWTVTTADGESRRHRALIVATGYNSVPVLPDWPGALDGPVVHTHDYRTPEPFAGLDVVVVGLGCSAAELACEIAEVARSTTLLARSGRDVMPHTVGPVPPDVMDTKLGSRMPWRLRRRVVAATSRLAVGDLTRHGLPARTVRPGDLPITVSSQLARSLRRGTLTGMTGAIARLAGDRVVLEGGRELPADALLAGTGYRAAFPFLPGPDTAPTVERQSLYRGIVSMAHPDLFFVGMVYGHGALLPMFEAQARWVASVLSGRLHLPDHDAMRASITADQAVRARDFDPGFGLMFDRQRYARHIVAEADTAGVSPRAAAPTVP
jgi:dimethylaniline monooxygenase (N-oxide forming)